MSKLHELNILLIFLVLSACNPKSDSKNDNIHATTRSKDLHSFSNPEEIAVIHSQLNLHIDFERRILKGSVMHQLKRKDRKYDQLFLDTRQLKIDRVLDQHGKALTYEMGKESEIFGSKLVIHLNNTSDAVSIFYETTPESEALQWLTPEQTHDKKHPFLFSQSQAILARTWIPCQDSPGNKFTYDAKISIDRDLMVLMSAINDTTLHENRTYVFRQPKPVSTYLMAIAAGNLKFRNTGRNSGVYAEPGQIEAAAWEFASMQEMIDGAEDLYGPYRWGRYDVLVLPPSFPFGGMENPCLTFATPTIIAGDRSLVSLIAHELAHSWSGNLVTNQTWNDFWLNEGFTVYFEQRIMEKLYGSDYERMLTVLGLGELQLTLKDFEVENKPEETHLYLNLEGRNPDDGLTDVAYEKGRFFLRHIEQCVGREKFDAFLKSYFNAYAFKPMNTAMFLELLERDLIQGDEALARKIDAKAWVYGPGIPKNPQLPVSSELNKAAAEADRFENGTDAHLLQTKGWTTHHWLHFLRNLKSGMDLQKMKALDETFHFTQSGNSEILCDWFKHCIDSRYAPARDALEKFLLRVGRRKFLTPLYSRLAKSPEDITWARSVFEKAKPGYHAVTVHTIEEMLEIKAH